MRVSYWTAREGGVKAVKQKDWHCLCPPRSSGRVAEGLLQRPGDVRPGSQEAMLSCTMKNAPLEFESKGRKGLPCTRCGSVGGSREVCRSCVCEACFPSSKKLYGGCSDAGKWGQCGLGRSDITRIACEGVTLWFLEIRNVPQIIKCWEPQLYSLACLWQTYYALGVICPQNWGQSREQSIYLLIISRLNICLGMQKETNGYAFHKDKHSRQGEWGGPSQVGSWEDPGRGVSQGFLRLRRDCRCQGHVEECAWVVKDQQQTPALLEESEQEGRWCVRRSDRHWDSDHVSL